MDWFTEARDGFWYTAIRVAQDVEYERAVLFASRAVKVQVTVVLHPCICVLPRAGTLSYGSCDSLLAFHDRSRDAWIRMQGQHGSRQAVKGPAANDCLPRAGWLNITGLVAL